jgi:hypothetical protein
MKLFQSLKMLFDFLPGMTSKKSTLFDMWGMKTNGIVFMIAHNRKGVSLVAHGFYYRKCFRYLRPAIDQVAHKYSLSSCRMLIRSIDFFIAQFG